MKDRPNLTQLSKEIYEANKLKCWHEQEYSNEHYLCLVISELMEAVEADRKGKKANLTRYNDAIKNAEYRQAETECLEWQSAFFHNMFKMDIKDSIEDELADAVIRLLDLAGVRGMHIRCDLDNLTFKGTFSENIYSIMGELHRIRSNHLKVNISILNIEDLCKQMDIDLWLHVELKLKYNLTRPYKHGKEY